MSRSGSLGAMPVGAVRRRLRPLGSDATDTGACGILGAANPASDGITEARAGAAARAVPLPDFPFAFWATGGADFGAFEVPPFGADFTGALAVAFTAMPFAFATTCVFRGDAFDLFNVFWVL